jgi:hypothetical protein
MRLLTSFALAATLTLTACQSMPTFSPSAASTDIAGWSHSVNRIRPPAAGCFTVSLPSTVWTQIACSTAGNLRGRVIGNGSDYLANVAPHVISSAEGWFPQVVGLHSVRSKNSGPGWSGSNSYSLQLNSQFFATSSCGAIAHCSGWVQFVYQNPPGKRAGSLLIWDWLVSTNSRKLSGCPPKAGWEYYAGFCLQTSHKSLAVPNKPIADLSKMSIVGMAAADGDSVIFGVGATKYAIRNAQNDDVAGLSANWHGAEFNVLAPGDGAMAAFNAGTTITVGIDVHDGAPAAPVCQGDAGTTAESNNLSFVNAGSSPASAYPSIRFRESNAAGMGSASCRALSGTETTE